MDKTQAKQFAQANTLAKKLHSDMEVAGARVGSAPESQLRWLLKFKDEDLNRLTSGEREALGFGLRSLPSSATSHGGKVLQSSFWAMASGLSMPDNLIADFQQWLRDFFTAMTSKEGKFELPSPLKSSVHRRSPLTSKGIAFQFIREFPYTRDGEQQAIQDAIINVVLGASDRLRFCLECKAPFIPHRKQAYCKPSCSQKARDVKRGKSYR